VRGREREEKIYCRASVGDFLFNQSFTLHPILELGGRESITINNLKVASRDLFFGHRGV
jgi:hypothetical protein